MDGTISEAKYPDGRGLTFEDGRLYEKFVAAKIYSLFGKKLHFFEGKISQLNGENKEGVEIKFDGRLKETGNLYIEIAEKSNAKRTGYFPSGIFRKDNSQWYWIGDYGQAFVFEKAVLQTIKKEDFKQVETATSKGFLIPIEQAKVICKRHFMFSRETNQALWNVISSYLI